MRASDNQKGGGGDSINATLFEPCPFIYSKKEKVSIRRRMFTKVTTPMIINLCHK